MAGERPKIREWVGAVIIVTVVAGIIYYSYTGEAPDFDAKDVPPPSPPSPVPVPTPPEPLPPEVITPPPPIEKVTSTVLPPLEQPTPAPVATAPVEAVPPMDETARLNLDSYKNAVAERLGIDPSDISDATARELMAGGDITLTQAEAETLGLTGDADLNEGETLTIVDAEPDIMAERAEDVWGGEPQYDENGEELTTQEKIINDIDALGNPPVSAFDGPNPFRPGEDGYDEYERIHRFLVESSSVVATDWRQSDQSLADYLRQIKLLK